MNKLLFGKKLSQILSFHGICAKDSTFIIIPVLEEGKKYTTKDEFVRLNVFPHDIITKKKLDYLDVIKRFSIFEPLYPLWIDIIVNYDGYIELYTSLRFRKPSQLIKQVDELEPFMFFEYDECIATKPPFRKVKNPD